MHKTDKPKTLHAVNAADVAHGRAADEMKLSADEEQLVRDFRGLSDEKQELYFYAIHDCAMEARSKRPALCRVAGGAA